MKHLALFAFAMALGFNASAGIICIDQSQSIVVRIAKSGKSEGIQNAPVQVQSSRGRVQGTLNLVGYIHTAQNGSMTVMSGDPHNGLDLEIKSLSDNFKKPFYSAELYLTIKGQAIETNVACANEENL